MKLSTLSIIIPTFNEATYIIQTLQRVLSSNTKGFKKEVIIVDDGSTDKTFQKVKLFLKNKKHTKKYSLRYIKNRTNKGKGAALKVGLLNSTGNIVLIQDADLEYNPEDYPLLLEPFLKHAADVVYGSRFISHRPHRVLYFWHSVGNILLTTLSNMFTNLNLTDVETGFKVFRGDSIRKIAKKLQSKRFGFEIEITARLAKIKTLRIYEVGISYAGRTYREGKKIRWHDGVLALCQIVKYNLLTT